MSLSSYIICIFVIIFIILQLSSGKEETQWKTHRLISKDGWSGKTEEFDDPIFVYALCNDKPLLNSKRECMVILYNDIHNNTAKSRQCMFTLENSSRGIIRIEHFGSDRAIFTWADEAKKNKTLKWTFSMAVIQMSNCEIVDTGLVLRTKASSDGDQLWYMLHVSTLVYEDTFEVIIQGLKACKDAIDDSHCVYTYDNDGKQIGGPVTRFSSHCDDYHYQFRSIAYRSPDKGYLLIARQKSLHVSIIKPTGKSKDEVITKMLWKYPMSQKNHSETCYTCNNEIIGMCSCRVLSIKLSCICLQFNEEDNSKKQMKIVVRKPSDATPAVLFMHNLRGGGFFFIPFYTDDKKHFYSMSKVNADGRVDGEPIVLGSHARTCSPNFVNKRFVEQDDGQYCITLACVEKNSVKMVLKTLTKCYTPSSFDRKFHAKDRNEL